MNCCYNNLTQGREISISSSVFVMAPAYKLTYFDITGFAEPIRFLFVYGDIEFEDVRVQLDFANWPKIKPNFPWGALPVLEHKGQVISQSVAISRYLAKLVGLTGKDALEDLEINCIVDCFCDLKNKMIEYNYCPDPVRKEELKKPFLTETLPYYMERFEAQIKKNNGHFVGGKLTWADIYICLSLVFFESYYLKDQFCDKYPAVRKLCNLITSNEKYKKYQANLDKHKIVYKPN